MLAEQIAVVMQVTDALEGLGIRYAIGGSFASAVYGVMRATMDADLVADLALPDVGPLARALIGDFYVDVESMREAVQQRSSFNLIHLGTMFKVDVFVAKARALSDSGAALNNRKPSPTAKEAFDSPVVRVPLGTCTKTRYACERHTPSARLSVSTHDCVLTVPGCPAEAPVSQPARHCQTTEVGPGTRVRPLSLG